MMISKKLFVRAIEEIQKLDDFDSELYSLHRKYDMDGYAPISFGCSNILVELLDSLFTPNNEDKDEVSPYDDINYFCYECNFGKDVRPGMILEGEKDISDSFTSAEKLYDYLTSRLN